MLESNRTAINAAVIIIPKPSITPSPSVTMCAGEVRLLSAPIGYTKYVWSDNSTNQQLEVRIPGSYKVKVGDGPCMSVDSDPVVVNVIPLPTKPEVTITNGNLTFCGSGSATLSGPTGLTYLWSNGATTPSITVEESAVITLRTENSNGCFSAPSEPIVVTKQSPPCKPNTPPVIDPIPVSVKIEGSVTVDLTKFIRDEEENIDYTRLRTLTDKTLKGATATIDNAYNLTLDYNGLPYSGSDRITLEVYDLYNQRAQRVIDIDVVGEVVVFNGITPDGDGKNDFFYIKYLDVIEGGLKNNVQIFDRWGGLVWETDDYDNIDRVFNGLSKGGSELPPGTYFYKVEFEGNIRPRTGFITLNH